MENLNIEIGDLISWKEPYFFNLTMNKKSPAENFGIVLGLYKDKQKFVKILCTNLKNSKLDVIYKLECDIKKM